MQVPVILIGPLVRGGGGGGGGPGGPEGGKCQCHNGSALSGNKLWHSAGSFLDAHRKIYGPQKGDYYFFTMHSPPPKKPKGPVRVRSQYGYSALLVSVPVRPRTPLYPYKKSATGTLGYGALRVRGICLGSVSPWLHPRPCYQSTTCPYHPPSSSRHPLVESVS